MSLAEQTARVAGGGKNALKKILQKLGVAVGEAPIDQYESIADQISEKLLPDNLLSADTSALYGLPETAVPDDVLKKISVFFSSSVKTVSGKYVGNGTGSKSLTFNGTLKFLMITGYWGSYGSGQEHFTVIIDPNESEFSAPMAVISSGKIEGTISYSKPTLTLAAENGQASSAGNESGKQYYYFGIVEG